MYRIFDKTARAYIAKTFETIEAARTEHGEACCLRNAGADELEIHDLLLGVVYYWTAYPDGDGVAYDEHTRRLARKYTEDELAAIAEHYNVFVRQDEDGNVVANSDPDAETGWRPIYREGCLEAIEAQRREVALRAVPASPGSAGD